MFGFRQPVAASHGCTFGLTNDPSIITMLHSSNLFEDVKHFQFQKFQKLKY